MNIPAKNPKHPVHLMLGRNLSSPTFHQYSFCGDHDEWIIHPDAQERAETMLREDGRKFTVSRVWLGPAEAKSKGLGKVT